jgi:phospholipid/cholesterol/gamma-HCH transport system substrate-binding protein
MDDRVLRLRVGVVVLAAALITAFLVARFGDLPLMGTGTYTVYINFPKAPGVSEGTPVRTSGVQIGRVRRIELLKPTGVQVEMEIDNERVLLDSGSFWISSASVLGDAVIDYIPLDPVPAGAKPIEGGTLVTNGHVAGNPLEALNNLQPQIESTLVAMRGAGTEVESVARNLNIVIGNNQDQIPRIMQQTERALTQFSTAMTNLNEVFDDPQMREDLRRSLRELPLMMDEARATLGKADDAFDSMKDFSEKAARNMENLENFTKPLGERGPGLVDDIETSLDNISGLLVQLNTFSKALNNREGTIGRIMYDDALYQRLDNTLANVEDITAAVKPIVGDFRILSDKLARDPSQILKLRSLMDRRPPGVGTKGTPTTGGYHSGFPAPHDQPIVVEGEGWDPVIVP